MDSISQEERVQLALKAFKDGQFKTKKAASLAFDVPETTLRRRIQGIASRSERAYNGLKLSPTEESTLSAWILDMDRRGLPLQLPAIWLSFYSQPAYHNHLTLLLLGAIGLTALSNATQN